MPLFTDVFIDVTKEGRKIPQEQYLAEGLYQIIDQGQNDIAGYSNNSDGIYTDVPVIVFGDHTRVFKYVDHPLFLGADGVKLLKPRDRSNSAKYLFYALKASRIPDTGYNRHFKWLKEVYVPVPSLNRQKEIASVLDKIEYILSLHKQQLAKLDELVKSQFIEMFGNPVTNNCKLPTMPMTSLCEIIDGDRGKNYPKAEDFSNTGYCLFLNTKNVATNGFNFDKCMFITEEKDKSLNKGRLKRGDLVLTTRGTIGNLAYYNETIPYEHIRINSGMVILRVKKTLLSERFFIVQFNLLLDYIKSNIVCGSAQPQLPISTMNRINILVPDKEKQELFSAFWEQSDKSKFAIQHSIEKLETLKASLMQEYFGGSVS